MPFPKLEVKDNGRQRQKVEKTLSEQIVKFNQTNDINLLLDIIKSCDDWFYNLPVEDANSKDEDTRKEFYEDHPNLQLVTNIQLNAKRAIVRTFLQTELNMPELKEQIKLWHENPLNEKTLKNVIDICENSLKSIPFEDRNKNSTAKILVEIQKQAVRDLTLLKVGEKFKEKNALSTSAEPKLGPTGGASRLAERWALLRSVVNPKNPGKMLVESQWTEYRYQGETFTENWINNSNDQMSYQQVQQAIRADMELHTAKNINYLQEENRSEFLVSFHKGKMMSNKEKPEPLDTSKLKMVSHSGEGGTTLYVATKNDVYVYNKDSGYNVRHSSILAGAPVLCAGTIQVENGELKMISTMSGHYRPGTSDIMKLLKILSEEKKIDLSKVVLEHFDNGKIVKYNAMEFYQKNKPMTPSIVKP